MIYNIGITLDITQASEDTNATYGLDNGVFYWVTGRPGYLGSGYSGDAPASKTWKEGFITSLNSIQPSVDIIDVEVAGNYATLSGFVFKVLNINQFFSTVDSNGWWMYGKPVNVYVFIDSVSYSRWYGVVSDISYNETEFVITCRGSFETRHKNFPPQSVTNTLFPFVDENVEGDIIPVSLGNINKAKCLPVYTEFTPLDIAIFDGVPYKTTALAFSSSVTNEIDLYTGTNVIAENQFKGYVLRAVVGGNNQTATIESNSASDTLAPANDRRTSFIVSKWFDDPPTNESDITRDPDSAKIWYFEISKFNTTNIISNQEISSFKEGDGTPVDVSYWDDSDKKYVPISSFAIDYSTSNIRTTNFPGVSLKSRGTEIDSDYFDKFSLTASEINLKDPIDGRSNPNYNIFGGGSTNSTTFTFNGDNPNLHDRDETTSYYITSDNDPSSGILNYTISYDCTIPEDFLEREYEESFLVFDSDIECSTNVSSCSIFVDYKLIDTRERETEALLQDTVYGYRIYFDSLTASTPVDLNLIPRVYYNEDEDDDFFNSLREDIDLSEYITNSKTLSAYKKIRVTINVQTTFATGNTFTLTMKELAFVGVKDVDLKNESVFCKVSGELNGVNETNNINSIYKHILEEYDGILSADIDYTGLNNNGFLGRQILDQKNSREYLSELAKQTFTGVFWDRQGTLNLKSYLDDTTSAITFDDSNIIKDSIKIFRDTSIDKVYNDFIIHYDWDEGRKKFNKTIGITNTDQIAFPAITASTGSDTDRSANFTSLTVHYKGSDGFWSGTITYSADISSWASAGITLNWDDGAGNIIHFAEVTFLYGSGKSIGIKFKNPGGVSVGVYTSVSTLVEGATSIQKWKTYAIGISDYATGKAWWDICHNSYLRTQKVNTLPKAYSDLYWYPDNNNFTPGTGGAGDAAYRYLQLLIERCTIPKKYTEFDIPINATNLQLNLLDYCTFNDVFYTSAADFNGWIEKIRTNYAQQTLTIGCMLEPTGIETDGIIIETGDAATTITESGSQPDTITEGA